jgi:hypothetical protein
VCWCLCSHHTLALADRVKADAQRFAIGRYADHDDVDVSIDGQCAVCVAGRVARPVVAACCQTTFSHVDGGDCAVECCDNEHERVDDNTCRLICTG